MLIPSMLLGAVIGSLVVAIIAYAFWMAGKLGVGPRW
jgi:hypothetical protein